MAQISALESDKTFEYIKIAGSNPPSYEVLIPEGIVPGQNFLVSIQGK